MSSRHWTLLIFLASLWGASYLFIKIGLEDLTPAAVVFLRTALAAAVLLPFAAYTKALGRPARERRSRSRCWRRSRWRPRSC